MIDLTTETPVQFCVLPKWTKKRLSRRFHPSTFQRWRIRGVHGIKLESVLVGGKRYTTEEALNRFFAATTAAADGESHGDAVVSDTVDAASVAKAEKYLLSQGIE